MVIFYKYRYFVGANTIKIIGKGPTHTWTEVLFFSIIHISMKDISLYFTFIWEEKEFWQLSSCIACTFIEKWESYFQHCYRFIIIKTELGLKNVWHFKKYINFLFLFIFFYIVWKHVYVFFSKPVVKRIHLEQLDNEWNSSSIAPVLQKLRSLSCIGIDKYLPFSMARLCDLISNF